MSWRDKKDKDKKIEPEFPFDFFSNKGFFGTRILDEFMKDISKMMSQIDDANSEMEVKQFGPYVWGYSMTMGPDGKPVVRQFGNMDQMRPQQSVQPQITEKRNEPLVDVFTDDDSVKLIIEMPGIEKDDVQISATVSKVNIDAKTGSREYSTEKELETLIDPQKYETKFNNGILELTFHRMTPEDEEEEFEVDIA